MDMHEGYAHTRSGDTGGWVGVAGRGRGQTARSRWRPLYKVEALCG